MKKELYELGRISNLELSEASRRQIFLMTRLDRDSLSWEFNHTPWPWLKDAVDRIYDPAYGCYIYYGLRKKEKKYKSVILRILQLCKNRKLLSRG